MSIEKFKYKKTDSSSSSSSSNKRRNLRDIDIHKQLVGAGAWTPGRGSEVENILRDIRNFFFYIFKKKSSLIS